MLWRKGGDSNPWYRFRHTRFPGVPIKPLSHPSSLAITITDKKYGTIVTNKQRLYYVFFLTTYSRQPDTIGSCFLYMILQTIVKRFRS